MPLQPHDIQEGQTDEEEGREAGRIGDLELRRIRKWIPVNGLF